MFPIAPHQLYTSEPRFSEVNCPDNEEYRFCEPCNRTCDNPNPICPAQCGRGCFCKEDLFRNRDGRCVPFNKCYGKSESCKLECLQNLKEEVVVQMDLQNNKNTVYFLHH